LATEAVDDLSDDKDQTFAPTRIHATKLGFACLGDMLVTVTCRGEVKVRDKSQVYHVLRTFQTMRPRCISVTKATSILVVVDRLGNNVLWDLLS
jgi:hypothetical protein